MKRFSNIGSRLSVGLFFLLVISGCGGGGGGVDPSNSPPVAVAGGSQVVNPGSEVTLDGSSSTDSDGQIVSYQWLQIQGDSVSLTDEGSATTKFIAPNNGGSTQLGFQLIVQDDDGAKGSDSITVIVTIKPVANAGADQIATQGMDVQLDGSSSSDTDGEIVAFQWAQVAGTPISSLINADTANPSFIAPLTIDREDLEFQLTVRDNDGAESSDTVVVTVNVKPEVSAGADRFVYDSTAVVLDGAASDIDGSIASNQWVQTGGDMVQLNGATTSSISFTTPSSTGVLTFSYTVTDNDGGQQSDTVSIFVSRALFSDTFDGTASLSNWTVVDDTGNGPSWSVVNGELIQQINIVTQPASFLESYHLGTFVYLNSSAFSGRSAFRFSVDIIPRTNSDDKVEGNDVGIMFPFNAADDDNYLRLSMNSRYGFTRFEKREGATFRTLAVNAIGYSNNQRMTITVEVNGHTVIVFVNGEPLFAGSNLNLVPGTVALYCQDRNSFDNVVIAENSLQPMIAVASPLAYSIALTPGDGNSLSAEAIVLNKPVDGHVMFTLDGDSELVAGGENNPYSAQFLSVADGEHEISATLRDANGVEVARDTNAVVGVGGDYIVTVGDSITNGRGDENPFNNSSADGRIFAWQGFQSRLADELTVSTGRPQIVFNEGIGGDLSTDLETERIDSILERHPGANKMLLLIGTNDAAAGISADVLKTNVTIVANQAATDMDLVYIAHILPIYDNMGNPETTLNNRIQEYNTRISQITGNSGDLTDIIFPGPDFYALFEGAYSTFYNPDGMHPNDAGYQEMANAWYNVLLTTP